MSIYWMSWIGIASAAFFGCLGALIVSACIRAAVAAWAARGDGNTSTDRIDRHARATVGAAGRANPEPHQVRPQSVTGPERDTAVMATASSFVEQKPNPDRVLVDPPMVGSYTLRDYLIHYANDDQVWAKLVADFYGTAASDAVVFAVFQKVARDKGMDVGDLVERVQKHFLAMLIVMTHVGLSVRLRDSLQSSHAFAGISADAYDRTVTALVQTLTKYGTPQEAFPPLVEMIGELQPYIVTR